VDQWAPQNAASARALCRCPAIGGAWNEPSSHPAARALLGPLNAKFEECLKRWRAENVPDHPSHSKSQALAPPSCRPPKERDGRQTTKKPISRGANGIANEIGFRGRRLASGVDPIDASLPARDLKNARTRPLPNCRASLSMQRASWFRCLSHASCAMPCKRNLLRLAWRPRQYTRIMPQA
jgi:hypothetical protein